MRLLELAPSVQAAVADRRITEGHARALGGLSVDHQDHVLGTVIEQDLSVRQTEELVRRLREPRAGAPGAPRSGVPQAPIQTSNGWRRTSAALSARRSSLARSRRGGRIVIEYYSDEELGRLYDRLTGGNA